MRKDSSWGWDWKNFCQAGTLMRNGPRSSKRVNEGRDVAQTSMTVSSMHPQRSNLSVVRFGLRYARVVNAGADRSE